jgi:hypothetical protein
MPTLAVTGEAGERHEVACYFPMRYEGGERKVAETPFDGCVQGAIRGEHPSDD